ncbi:MAG: iron-sulfur cluster repair protein YtfE [Planctomycetes bacterium]|nr:iron-sulfur cluster repair protein YtfE [Planctomycetota bacterium]
MRTNLDQPVSPSPESITADVSLGDLATRWAGASRVFVRHGLDFCCNGRESIAAACRRKGLEPGGIVAELLAELTAPTDDTGWQDRPTEALVRHIVARYHQGHRDELPRLVRMASKVEAVHGDKPFCPRGLAAFLQLLGEDLESHMQKEEQVLFPLLLAAAHAHAAMPITVMEREHEQHGVNLTRLRQLAHDFVPPAQACGTWRALYLGLAEFEREVMQHIALENHVLFPRARA